MQTAHRRIVILAEGKFGPLESKTANQAIRYIPERVVGVIDSRRAGQSAGQVLGFGGDLPVRSSLGEFQDLKPDALLIGIAPTGGKLPAEWRPTVLRAIDLHLDVISGLHTLLSEDTEIAHHAGANGVRLFDLRKVGPEYEVVARGTWKTRRAKTILSVGTDCNVGKMTASLELHREFLRRGLRSDFIATGQTGILLAGKGVAVDSLLSDYVSGAIELEVDRSAEHGSEIIHVEGQGSLTHQGYSSVTLGLIHGVMPDAFVLVHHPSRKADDYGFPLDDVRKLVDLHERIIAPFKNCRVAGIAMNTVLMTAREAEAARTALAEQTGLPVADVLGPGVRCLADALLDAVRDTTGVAGR